MNRTGMIRSIFFFVIFQLYNNRMKEFCSDIEQLTRAMQTLFNQDPAVLLVFGVSVKVEVNSEAVGMLFKSELGAEVGDKIDD